MNRKYLMIGLILIVAVTSLAVVSAGETVNFKGVDFNVPDGYSEVSIREEMQDTIKMYENSEGSIIFLVVQDTDIGSFMEGSDDPEHKIGNIDGYLTNYDDGISFTYGNDTKSIMIFAPDEDTVKEVLKV